MVALTERDARARLTEKPSRGTRRYGHEFQTQIDRNSPEFQANTAYFQQQLEELRQRVEQVQQGGGPEAIAKHRKRNKLLARERIQLLCDPDTPFLEFSPLAAWDMYEDEAPSAGIVTGIGAVQGQEC